MRLQLRICSTDRRQGRDRGDLAGAKEELELAETQARRNATPNASTLPRLLGRQAWTDIEKPGKGSVFIMRRPGSGRVL